MTHIEAMKQALEALELASTWKSSLLRGLPTWKGVPYEQWTVIAKSIVDLRQAIEQRCSACNYEYGHAIGCKHNPMDIALAKMADNVRKVEAKLKNTSTQPRKPLSNELLEKMAEKHVTNCYFDTLKYARAIEAAHNITKKDDS